MSGNNSEGTRFGIFGTDSFRKHSEWPKTTQVRFEASNLAASCCTNAYKNEWAKPISIFQHHPIYGEQHWHCISPLIAEKQNIPQENIAKHQPGFSVSISPLTSAREMDMKFWRAPRGPDTPLRDFERERLWVRPWADRGFDFLRARVCV